MTNEAKQPIMTPEVFYFNYIAIVCRVDLGDGNLRDLPPMAEDTIRDLTEWKAAIEARARNQAFTEAACSVRNSKPFKSLCEVIGLAMENEIKLLADNRAME